MATADFADFLPPLSTTPSSASHTAEPRRPTSTSPGAAATTSRPPTPFTPLATRRLDMLDSNGNGMHHEDDDGLFTDSDPVLPDPSQMGAHDGILLREWSRLEGGMFGMRASGTAASWVVGWMGTDAHLYDDLEDAAILALLDSRFDAHLSFRSSPQPSCPPARPLPTCSHARRGKSARFFLFLKYGRFSTEQGKSGIMTRQQFYCGRCDLLYWLYQWQIYNHIEEHVERDREEEEREAERRREREAAKAKKERKKGKKEAKVKKATGNKKTKNNRQGSHGEQK
ncbi:hypothetical protein ZWY2020_029947 [Hordeum vulgare]|nr:hypothetical protein ZWY2020_029947 [Hordeum vulgare]